MTKTLGLTAAALLALVPPAVGAGRSAEFTASFDVRPVEHRLFELPGGPAGYVRLLLRDPALGRRTVAISGLPIDDASIPGRIGLRTDGERVTLDVAGATPDRARSLAAGLRIALERTARAAFRAEAAARRRFVRSRLKSPLTTPADRRDLARRAAALPAFFRARDTRLVIGAPPARPRPTRVLDRAADALPGRYPPAAPPLAAAAAGLLAALALLSAAVAARVIPAPRLRAPARGRRPRRPRTARRRSPP